MMDNLKKTKSPLKTKHRFNKWILLKGLSHLWNIPDESPEFESEMEVESAEHPREKAIKALVLTDDNCKKCFIYM